MISRRPAIRLTKLAQTLAEGLCRTLDFEADVRVEGKPPRRRRTVVSPVVEVWYATPAAGWPVPRLPMLASARQVALLGDELDRIVPRREGFCLRLVVGEEQGKRDVVRQHFLAEKDADAEAALRRMAAGEEVSHA